MALIDTQARENQTNLNFSSEARDSWIPTLTKISNIEMNRDVYTLFLERWQIKAHYIEKSALHYMGRSVTAQLHSVGVTVLGVHT